MLRMDKWSIAHRYNKLVRAGLAAPLTSPGGVEYILRANSNFEPCYWLSTDDSLMVPGLDFWRRMRDAVDLLDLDNPAMTVLH
jgi:hypothetical protein